MLRTLLPRLNAQCLHQQTRQLSSSHRASQALRIGFVPEHFSTPLHFARQHFKLDAELIPFPSGTGAMVQSLESSEIDVGIGLTEGWAAGLAKAQKEKRTMPYRFVGTYVESPLCWAINKGKENTTISSMADLKGKKVGVSRIGSGSYVMSFVLADQQGWLQEPSSQSPSPFSEFVTLNNFKELRDGVNGGKADFFMWETFTSKRYHDSGEIAKVGEINTPWSSWMIVTRDPTDRRTEDLAEKLNHGISYFNEHRDEAVDYISTELDYSKEDADEWIKTVKFADDVRGVDPGVVKDTVDTLGKARVLDEGEVGEGLEMIGIKRTSRGR